MSDPFRSMATSLFHWPVVEGVLRELGKFEPCTMCQRDAGIAEGAYVEHSNVHYGGKATCYFHARQLPELHHKAGYAKAATSRPSDVLDHDFVWEEDDE